MSKVQIGNLIIDDIKGTHIGKYPIYMTLKRGFGINLTFAIRKDSPVEHIYGFINTFKKLRDALPRCRVFIENGTIANGSYYTCSAYRVRINLKIIGLKKIINKLKRFFDEVEGIDTNYNVCIELRKDIEEEYNNRLMDLI